MPNNHSNRQCNKFKPRHRRITSFLESDVNLRLEGTSDVHPTPHQSRANTAGRKVVSSHVLSISMDWYLTPVPVFHLLLCKVPVISRADNLLRLALKPFNCEEIKNIGLQVTVRRDCTIKRHYLLLFLPLHMRHLQYFRNYFGCGLNGCPLLVKTEITWFPPLHLSLGLLILPVENHIPTKNKMFFQH